MIAGVISDTHGYLDERVLPFFDGIDVILHAGDIGSMAVLEQLGTIAAVFAVEGNNDVGLDLGVEERLIISLEGHRVQLVHQLPDAEPGSEVIVHGHSHKLLNEWRGETLYLNPGAAGRRGFHAVQSIALLRLEEHKRPEAELIVLGPRLASAARPRRSSH
jgi:putative phosphoesterase